MAIVHIILLAFKEGTSSEKIHEVASGLLALKDKCVHPETQKPYMISASGGKDVSSEGLQNGMQYAFVMEFESIADRDYYVAKDPAHLAMVGVVGPSVEKLLVLDYNAGEF